MGWGCLTADERRVVLECLRAASDGPFFPDEEFHTLFGLYRDEVSAIVAAGPDLDDEKEDVRLAINNAMNSLLGYPHRREDVWADYISVSRAEVDRVFRKWRGDADRSYFKHLN